MQTNKSAIVQLIQQVKMLHTYNEIINKPSLSRSIVVSNSSKCLNFISNFFICVSTSNATKDLIFLSSTAAKCLALTAAAARAAAAAACILPSVN